MFGYHINLFRLFGIPIRIDLSWFLIVALITWTLAQHVFPPLLARLEVQPGTFWLMGFTGALGLFVSILLHELAHAIVAQRYGMEMRGITLFIFGGVAEMADEPPNARAEFFIAIAGPAMSVVLGLSLYLVNAIAWPLPVAAVVGWLALINFVLVAFNMLPAFPLDGGRVLRSILWQWKANLRWATRVTSRIGAGFGIVLMVAALLAIFAGNLVAAIWWFLIGMFLRHAARMSYQQILIRETLRGEPVARFMRRDIVTVAPQMPLDHFVDDVLYRHHYKMYPAVKDDGRIIGCVSVESLKQFNREQWPQHTVSEIMTNCSSDNTIRADADAIDALEQMSRHDQSRLMVVDDGRLQGIIALRDLMGFLRLKLELEEGEPRAQGV